MKHILITGGAGFIGSHLTEFLLKLGHHVTVVDNLQTGSLSNLAFCKDHPDFSFIQQDVCDPLDFEVDEIYHLAMGLNKNKTDPPKALMQFLEIEYQLAERRTFFKENDDLIQKGLENDGGVIGWMWLVTQIRLVVDVITHFQMQVDIMTM